MKQIRFFSSFSIQSFNSRAELRSDTFTLPSDACRKAAYESQIGDNVWQTDLPTIELENQLAAMFNKPKGLFFPSGTMANLAALMVIAQNHSFILGDQSHIYKNEQGGIASIAGIMPRIVKNTPSGGFDIQDLIQQQEAKNIHVASNKGIALEVTHNVLNGDIPDNLTQITKLARLMNWHTHLDGARLFNGMVVKQWEGPEIGKEFDSLCVSLSKGLGCPIGSVLLGEEGFIEEARYKRKLLGGGMRQTGMIAQMAIEALKDWRERIEQDHKRTQWLAEGISGVVKLGPVKSNMVRFEVEGVRAKDFCEYMESKNVGMAQVRGTEKIRACLHQNVNDGHIEKTIQVVKEGVEYFGKK